jgi:hypothetical protein
MNPSPPSVRVIEGCQPDDFPLQQLLLDAQPVLLKGLVKDWGLTKAGLRSTAAALDYLRSFYNGLTVNTFVGLPQIKGRYFYNEDLTGFNYEAQRVPMDKVLNEIQAHLQDAQPPSFYIGSTTIDACLPGLRNENDLPFDKLGYDPLASIWIGNRSVIASHQDAPVNLACTVVGRRRFTLFPPDQIANLYPGSLELNPGGRAISMVDFANPDYARYPRFREALAVAQVAEMEPGDALFLPSLWWHQVEGLSEFNVLINYWWSISPGYLGDVMKALHHAIWTLRDRPESEKLAWKNIFDYYVFGPSQLAGEHLPEHARGQLGPMDDAQARQIRAMLINHLNR